MPRPDPIGTSVTFAVSTLPTSYEWVEFVFSDVTLKQLNKEFVIVVKADMNNAAQVQYLSSTSAPKDDPVMVWTIDGGSKWLPRKNQQADNDIYFRVWGTYETSDTETTEVTRDVLASTGLTLQVGADTSMKNQTAVQVLNAPDVRDLGTLGSSEYPRPRLVPRDSRLSKRLSPSSSWGGCSWRRSIPSERPRFPSATSSTRLWGTRWRQI